MQPWIAKALALHTFSFEDSQWSQHNPERVRYFILIMQGNRKVRLSWIDLVACLQDLDFSDLEYWTVQFEPVLRSKRETEEKFVKRR